MDEYINRTDFMCRISSNEVKAEFEKMTGREAYEKLVGLLNSQKAIKGPEKLFTFQICAKGHVLDPLFDLFSGPGTIQGECQGNAYRR